MRWRRNLRLSARSLRRSAGRTLLSVGAVAIGVAAVVLLVGAGAGAEAALRRALEPLGRDLLLVSPARIETSALRGEGRIVDTLLASDAVAIEREVGGVREVAPVAERTLPVSARGRTVPQRVTGTTPSYARARNFRLVAGRFLDDADVEESRRVAVVSAMVVSNLFAGESPLDEVILVGGVSFRVIGVTAKKGIGFNGANEDELVFVPLGAAMRRLLDVESLSHVFVQMEAVSSSAAIRASIASLLRERHAAVSGGADDFSIRDQTGIVRAQQASRRPLMRWIPGLAALTLGLGGFGLFAVSILSVRERHAEIGIRLAAGALPRDILLQFFAEAMLVSVAGGGAGLALGGGAILAAAAWTAWPMAWSWQAVLYALGVSVMIATVFGPYPALCAARLDPIRALTGASGNR